MELSDLSQKDIKPRRRDPMLRPRQRTDDDAAGLWEDERVIAWVAAQDKVKVSREDMVTFSKEGSHGWPVPGKHLAQNAVDRARVIIKDRRRHGREAQKGRATWNGKSKRQGAADIAEIRRRRPKVASVLNELAKMRSVLEDIHPEDFELNGLGPWEVSIIYEDLVTLAEWSDRTLSSVSFWIEDGDVRKKIAILRDTTGRTPEEAATARRLADRLEQKLDARFLE